MADADRLRQVRRDQVVDLGLAFRGATPIALGKVAPEATKSPTAIITGPAGKIWNETVKEWKKAQQAYGEGPRAYGFDRATELLAGLAGADGVLTVDSVCGARDAVLRRTRTGSSRDYRRAFRLMTRAVTNLPVEHSTYPRTQDGFRGGVIAATAAAYGSTTKEPMLGKAARVVESLKRPKWISKITASMYGAGASGAGSVLDAVKEIVERGTESADKAVDALGEIQAALEEWRDMLARVSEGATARGADEAISAASAAVESITNASTLTAEASGELRTWAQGL